jgi:hypothetical protein
MAEKAVGAGRAVVCDGGPPVAFAACTGAPWRELAQRVSGTIEVVLLWCAEGDRVELSVRDRATGTEFHVDVARGDALDAFDHPYAYAAAHTSSCHAERSEATCYG